MDLAHFDPPPSPCDAWVRQAGPPDAAALFDKRPSPAGVDLAPFYPPRPEDSRKGDFGTVLVVGGSDRYAGALAFNALAALRCGADLALVVAPRRAADLVGSYAPDLITVPCNTPWPDPPLAKEIGQRADALVLGGGVERTPRAHAALRQILTEWEKPVVVDAEALRALVGHEDLLAGKTVLLTPHGGEYAALAGKEWPQDLDARKDAARRLATRTGATVVVKGRHEVVSDGDRIHVDPEGSPFLTKGGYGDLLAGACGALMARGHSPYDAARAGTWIIGRAGAAAAEKLGESTVASDALAEVPRVLGEALRR